MAELLPMLLPKSKERDTAKIPSNVANGLDAQTAGPTDLKPI